MLSAPRMASLIVASGLGVLPMCALGQSLPNAVEFAVRGSLVPSNLGAEEEAFDIARISEFRDPILWDDPSINAAREGVEIAGPDPDTPIGPPLRGPDPPQLDSIENDSPPTTPAVGNEEEFNPFEAPGVMLGSFLVRSRVDLGVTATDNVDGGPVKEGAVGVLAAAEISGRSEWQKHEVYFELRAEADLYEERGFDDGFLETAIGGRIDVTDRTGITAGAGYAYILEDFTDPTTPGTAAERPANQSLVGRLGIVHENNSVRSSLSGRLTRRIYNDIPLIGGGVADQSFRDRTISAIDGRVAIRPEQQTLAPLAIASVGKTDYDQRLDPLGFARSNVWFELRGGLVIDRDPKLVGEVTIGYRNEDFEDPRLSDLDALVVSADLAWSPARLTTVRLDVDTFTDSSTVAFSSGSLTYAGVASIERRFRNRFSGEAGFGYSHEDYRGIMRTDQTYLGYGQLSYNMSKYAALVGRYSYERTNSTDPGVTGDEHRVDGFVRLER